MLDFILKHTPTGRGWRVLVTRAVPVLLLGVLVASFGCSGILESAARLEKKGDLEGAISIYREVLADSPDNPEALSGLAVDLMLLRRYDEALPIQERLATLDPSDAQIRVELGFNYLNHQNSPQKAVKVLQKAVALEPTAKNLCFLAQAQDAAREGAAAEASLRRAISLDPGYERAYVLLIRLLDRSGRSDELATLLESAESHGLDPDYLRQAAGSDQSGL